MTSFDQREEALEAKFAHDGERAFKVRAPALRMLGLRAAGKLGETEKVAEDYAQALIEADIGAPESALNKLLCDLASHRVDAKEIRQIRDGLLAIVRSASA